jgi:prepilin peptidase CpaA
MTGTELTCAAACAIAVFACTTDLRSRRIPNALVLVGLISGVGLNSWAFGVGGLMSSLFGAAVGLALFLPVFALGGMGGGDVKLLAALGAMLGSIGILKVAVVAALSGGLLALIVALFKRRCWQMLRGTAHLLIFWTQEGLRPCRDVSLESASALKIPYAVPIAIGTFFVTVEGWL